MRPNKTINIIEALATLALLEDQEGIKLTEATTLLDLSVPTLKRHIRILRELGVDITWIQKDQAYLVGDWGIFDRHAARQLLAAK